MSATIDVDIGGTFTDCFVTYGATRIWCKTRTTTYDLSVGMNETIEEAASRLSVDDRGAARRERRSSATRRRWR